MNTATGRESTSVLSEHAGPIRRILGRNSLTLRQKLICSYILVVLIPVLLVGAILTGSMRRLALDRAIHEATAGVERVKKLVTDAMHLSISISNRFFIDRVLEKLLEQDYATTWEVVSAYRDYPDFDVYPELYPEIGMIRAYSANPTLLENWRIMRVTPEILQSAWYQQSLSNKGRITWSYVWFPELKKSYYTLTRSITGGNPVGVLTVSLNPDYLLSILGQESFDTLLIDEQGEIISASDRSLIGATIKTMGLEAILHDDQLTRQINYRGTLYEIISDSIYLAETNGGLRIVSLFPVDQIVAKAHEASRLGLTIICISLLLSFSLILILSGFLTERIRILSESAHKVAAGNLDYSLVVEGEDEIAELSRDLNQMVGNIQDLLTELHEVHLQKQQLEIRQRDIRLSMLASQMNPHFLFNVLETIRMRAHTRGDTDIALIVKKLGKLIRRNLDRGSEPVPITTELEMVTDYLEIQKFRFGERLQYCLNIDDEAKGRKILPLVIQPIVENAVVHGIEKKEAQGLVCVSVDSYERCLRISVSDNGVGMSEDRLRWLLDSLEDVHHGDSMHIGIRNVYQRLRLFYGEGSQLSIRSKLGHGTEVKILLPWEG